MNSLQRQSLIENWIAQDELPARPGLKPIRLFDGLYPEDEDERQAYWDFIHWYVSQESITIQMLRIIRFNRADAKDPFSKEQLNLFQEA